MIIPFGQYKGRDFASTYRSHPTYFWWLFEENKGRKSKFFVFMAAFGVGRDVEKWKADASAKWKTLRTRTVVRTRISSVSNFIVFS